MQHPVLRRHLLVSALALGSAALLAACAQAPTAPKPADAPKTPADPKPATPAQPVAAKPAESKPSEPKPAAKLTPRGELKIGGPQFFVPARLEPTQGLGLMRTGNGETLTRVNDRMELQPWLAEKVANVDPTTWRVTLRPNAKFWDGSPVTAKDVAASITRAWEVEPGSKRFVSADTKLEVKDDRTLDLRTPAPVGDLGYNLGARFFVIAKTGGEIPAMTGPYKITAFQRDTDMTLEAFADHWAGPPAVAKLQLKGIVDANSRMLGIQSGDLDMAVNVPPELVKDPIAGIEVHKNVTSRIDLVIPNHTVAPFNDKTVRQAVSYALDRDQLNNVALAGMGTPLTGMFPPGIGIESVPTQSTDRARAVKLLDEAGWKPGPDGIRAKGADRLAFVLLSYQGQFGDLPIMAVSIQSQLKSLGIEVTIQEVRDISGATKVGNFQAAMWTTNTLDTGDPYYMFGVHVAKGGLWNPGRYENPAVEELLAKWRAEVDPAKRAAFNKQAQELVGPEVVNFYLAGIPRIFAVRKDKVKAMKLHPSDNFIISHDWVELA